MERKIIKTEGKKTEIEDGDQVGEQQNWTEIQKIQNLEVVVVEGGG